jgi:DNA polymerase I-like protein with 3'-5' exonuclease and polymerase domains
MKLKMLRVYNERNTIGIHKMRQQVHDEQCGDKDPDPKYTKLIEECFNVQEVPLRVPILWDLTVGQDWGKC